MPCWFIGEPIETRVQCVVYKLDDRIGAEKKGNKTGCTLLKPRFYIFLSTQVVP